MSSPRAPAPQTTAACSPACPIPASRPPRGVCVPKSHARSALSPGVCVCQALRPPHTLTLRCHPHPAPRPALARSHSRRPRSGPLLTPPPLPPCSPSSQVLLLLAHTCFRLTKLFELIDAAGVEADAEHKRRRADSADSHELGGSGLGVAFTKDLITAKLGECQREPERKPKRPTTFRVF